MSNLLKKGKRQLAKQQKKDSKKAVARFQQTLAKMNEVYSKLMGDPFVTEENLLTKVKEISDFEFSDKQLAMLAKDVLTNKGLLNEEQQQPREEGLAFPE